jgi:hypothetical protein
MYTYLLFLTFVNSETPQEAIKEALKWFKSNHITKRCNRDTIYVTVIDSFTELHEINK